MIRLRSARSAAIWATSASVGLPFRHVAAEVLQRRSLVLRVALLGVQLNERTGLGERDEGDLIGGPFGGGEVPGRECTLKSCARIAFRGHERTF